MSSAGTSLSDPLVVTTKLDVEEFNFQWNIDLRSSCMLLSRGRKIKSPVFPSGNKLKCSWQLELTIETDKSSFCFTLVDVSETSMLMAEKNHVKATAFASYKGASDAIAQGGVSFTKVKSGSTQYIPFDDLYINAKNYLQNNVLTFYCVIVMDYGIDYCPTTSRRVNSFDVVVRSLQTALKSADFSDVTIVTKTKKIPAHKFILAAQSPVFAAMFRSRMEEGKINFVEIKDFDEKIVDSMIEYVYTGKTILSSDKEQNVDLLRISDKYELLELKSSVEDFLVLSVKLKTAVELLVLAFLYNCDGLKKTTICFINSNKDKLNQTEDFKKLGSGSHPHILKELFLSTNKKEMTETDSVQNLAISQPKMLMDLYLTN